MKESIYLILIDKFWLHFVPIFTFSNDQTYPSKEHGKMFNDFS